MEMYLFSLKPSESNEIRLRREAAHAENACNGAIIIIVSDKCNLCMKGACGLLDILSLIIVRQYRKELEQQSPDREVITAFNSLIPPSHYPELLLMRHGPQAHSPVLYRLV